MSVWYVWYCMVDRHELALNDIPIDRFYFAAERRGGKFDFEEYKNVVTFSPEN